MIHHGQGGCTGQWVLGSWGGQQPWGWASPHLEGVSVSRGHDWPQAGCHKLLSFQTGQLEPLLSRFTEEEDLQMKRMLQRMDVLAKVRGCWGGGSWARVLPRRGRHVAGWLHEPSLHVIHPHRELRRRA